MTYKITLNETQVVVHEAVAGPQGATGSAGVVSATDPITYNSTTKDVGFNATGFVKTAIANTFTVGAQIIKTGADAVKGLTLTRNSASQSANLLSVTGSDGITELARIRPNGQLGVGSLITNALLGLNQDQVGDNRGLVIKAGVTTPANNAIEILPLASNTAVLSVTHAGDITTGGDITSTATTGSVTAGLLNATVGTLTLGTVSNSSKIGTIDLYNGSSGGKSQIFPRVGTSATTINYLPVTAGTIAALDDITTTNLSGTSLPLVTSVNGTNIPSSAASLLTPTSTLDPTKLSTGTAGISITGNAGTVTNGVYTTTTSLPNVTSVNSTTIPASSTLVTSANFRAGQLSASGTIDVVPRMQVGSTRAMTAGTVYFTGFSPVADVTVSKITTVVTAVSGTNTLQYGIYSVSGTTVTTIATTAVSGTVATGLVELSFSSAPTLTAGSNYMIGFLAVGGTSVTVAGTAIQNTAALQGNGSSGVLTPLIAGSSSTTSYGSLPSSGNVGISSTVAASFAFARLN